MANTADAPHAQTEPSAARQPEPTPFWEKVVGLAGLLMVLAMLTFLVYLAREPDSPPVIIVEAGAITPTEGGYRVEITATNQGDATAAAVVIAGNLFTGDDPTAQPAETSEMTFDYVPAHSSRQGGLFFALDPAQYRLDLRAKSYMDP
jgi:uncharacterized protein (TIGR02588 family)